jgi:hypothetical protein
MIPPKIKMALDHVRSFFPDVTKVSYDSAGRWRYSTDSGFAPKFNDRIDVSILEDAADAVEELPCKFEI